MDRMVKCTVCKLEYPVGRQVEAAERAHWTCHRCANGEISLDLLDFIRRKIHGTRAQYENHIRFVLRELVQNADDAGATIVVLRFDSDALFVANNGRAFTTTSTGNRLSDFDAISAILKQSKAEDEEMTGHFGSGFQTVYALTNAPEVHSSGRSGRMNAVDQEWAFLEEKDSNRLVSPYLWRAEDEPRGVLFRFPWRDDKAAMEDFGGKHPFSNDNDWPRWNESAIRQAYDNLRDYVQPLLLCCNQVRVIRLVWAAAGKAETYQAERDFGLKEVRPEAYVGHVVEGAGSFPQAWFSWTSRSSDASTSEWRSYQLEGWKQRPDSRTFSYLIRSGYVSDDKGNPLFIGQRPDGAIVITYRVQELKKKLKTNDVHVLLPLFDSKKGFRGDGPAFLYSVIPLPTHSGNRFAFSGHFFPTEDRMDVAVSSLGGRDGEWHQAIVLSVGKLYRDTFPLFLQKVQGLKGVDENEKQTIVLNTAPGVPLHQWMRPGKDVTFSQWADQLNHQILVTLVRLPLMYCEGRWVPPAAAHWPSMPDGSIDPSGSRLLSMFGAPAFTKDFVSHPNFAAILSSHLQGRKLDAHTVTGLFSEFVTANGGELTYGRKLSGGRQLKKEEISNLIEFFIMRHGAWTDTMGLAVVPGQDGVMRPVSDYKIVPERFESLTQLMSPSMLVHPDFAKALETVNKDARTLNADRALELFSRLADEQPSRFSKLSENDHKAVTSLLIAVSGDPDFKLKASHAGLKFIPFLVSGHVSLGLPNSKTGPDGKRVIFEGRRGDYYRHDYIFLPPEAEVPGLTTEVRNRIQFLDLKDADRDSVDQVGEVLHLLGLQDEDKAPTNFVRHFLSERHESLFNDEVLGQFIGTKNPQILDKQKRAFLHAMAAYYNPDGLSIPKGSDRYGKTEEFLTPRQIGKIPCVYDTAGKWGCPADFAMNLTPELEILDYKALHSDFNTWDSKTLEAMGVERRPQTSKVVEKVQSLVKDPTRNRRVIADIVALILTSDQAWTDQLRELEQIPWIPTRDGAFHRQRETVVSNAENRRLLGDNFPFMFDSAACSAPLRARLGPECEGLKPDRARDLKLLQRPGLQMLMGFTSSLAAQRKPPPQDLFRLLAESLTKEDPAAVESGFYYNGGRWWEGHHIVISDDPELKRLLGDSNLFLRGSEIAHVEGYLHAIGAKDTINPSDLLEKLTAIYTAKGRSESNSDELALNLWTRLEQLSSAIDRETAGAYKSRVTYPVQGGQVTPQRIILFPDSDRGAWPEDGWIGEWFAVADNACRHQQALRTMGAKTPRELSVQDLRGLTESIYRSRRALSKSVLDTLAYLVLRWHKLEPTADLRDLHVWPVERGTTYSVEKVGSWYIRDDSASSYFEGKVAFLHEPSLPQVRQEFLEVALHFAGEGCLVSRAVEGGLADSTTLRSDTALQTRIVLMAEAFRIRFGTAYRQAPESIDWLKSARVFRADRLRTVLSLSGVQCPADSSCVLSKKDKQVTILRVEIDPSLPDRLTSVIVQECLQRGFPVDTGTRTLNSARSAGASASRDAFEDLTYRLLTRDPGEWHLFVPGLREISEWVPPLLEIAAEARRGYSETKQSLLGWYGRCQICGRRTPATADASETCELVRSIVSNRGGLYSGRFEAYTIGNALFLCPSHHALYLRRLVRLPDIDKARKMGPEGIRRLREMASRPTSNLVVEVFETPEGSPDTRPRWRSLSLTTSPDHAAAILKWMADWMEREQT